MMIAFVRGNLLFRGEDYFVVDVSGVGYQLQVSSFAMESYFPGDSVELHVYTHVREDQLQLFGFLNRTEKDLFLSFIKVNGIGPKMAMQALSGARAEQIINMVEEGDVGRLTKLPKLGKKKAEQVILTLKGKLVFAEEEVRKQSLGPKAEIYSALLNLGYNEPRVREAMEHLEENVDVESGIRKSLSLLSAGM